MAIKFRICKRDGKAFVLKAETEKGSTDMFRIWYKQDKFWRSWQFLGISEYPNTIEQTIYYHFGFTTEVHRIS